MCTQNHIEQGVTVHISGTEFFTFKMSYSFTVNTRMYFDLHQKAK